VVGPQTQCGLRATECIEQLIAAECGRNLTLQSLLIPGKWRLYCVAGLRGVKANSHQGVD
jgi:hypothetical protein